MSEEQRRQLKQQLWNIANTLRGKMGADEFGQFTAEFVLKKHFLLNIMQNIYKK